MLWVVLSFWKRKCDIKLYISWDLEHQMTQWNQKLNVEKFNLIVSKYLV